MLLFELELILFSDSPSPLPRINSMTELILTRNQLPGIAARAGIFGQVMGGELIPGIE
jgi:hypothetical protein